MSDFDNLRHGRISRNEFRRAIKIIYSNLTETDLCMLETKFAAKDQPTHVEYIKFSDLVENVFTKKGLEKTPTEVPAVFNVYSNGWEANPFELTLSKEEDLILRNVMRRLNARIVSRRVDALSYMEDYDFVKEGTL